MTQKTHHQPFKTVATIQHDNTLAERARQRVLNLSTLPIPEQTLAIHNLINAEGWKFCAMGGFAFADGSILKRSRLGWQALSAVDLQALRKQPLEVRLRHSFQNSDGCETYSVAEAHFELRQHSGGWQLVVEYEAYMNSPLYHFKAERFTDLLELPLRNLRVDTPGMSQRWRLEEIALHHDWLDLLHVSSAPTLRHDLRVLRSFLITGYTS
jgi:hypothetical protein